MKEVNTESTAFIALGFLCAALTLAGVYLLLSRTTQDYGSAFLIAVFSSGLVFKLFHSHASTLKVK